MISPGTDAATLAPRHGRLTIAMPMLMELLMVLAAIGMFLPEFERVAGVGNGRDQRFAQSGISVSGLPQAVLPDVCAAHAATAESLVRDKLCGPVGAKPAAPSSSGLPESLTQALSRSTQAFVAPLIATESRLNALRQQQREGLGELRGLADAIAAIEAESQPFVDRFQLAADGHAVGPLPLRCAARWAQDALTGSAARQPADTNVEMARSNVVLLLAAALDGRAATGSVAAMALLPATRVAPAPPCNMSGAAALSATAALMADARQTSLNARKNEAMRALMQSAGWQWAGAMLLGFGLLLWSRRPWSPVFGVAGALMLWAVAAWVARVPWPLAGSHEFQPARSESLLWSRPSDFVLWLFAGAAALLLWGLASSPKTRAASAIAPTQAMSSRIGYAGLVLATGLGWLLLLDLSANGHPGTRYLALYHQGHLWLGMSIFSVLLFLRRPLSRGLGWTLSIIGETARHTAQRLGPVGAVAALTLSAAAAATAFGLTLSNMRQLTSELGRVWLIIGAAWFFFLRAGPLAERLARTGSVSTSFLRHVWPLLFVIAMLIAAMLITRDMGPLLIAGYASGAFIAAAVAMWWHQRSGRTISAFLLAIVLFSVWIGATTVALFKFGSVDGVTATRLESLEAPFASINDQLALVSWFQRAAPAEGFGIGAVPWCGYAATGNCSGVPAQIHSDYTFTAIVGVYGTMAAWVASLGCAVWLHRLIRHHGRVTRGEPRLITTAGHIGNDGQALLSWIGVAWVVLTSCQLAVTVAGNLAVLPLTGVTFPFISFGMTSLLVNLAFLALCVDVGLPLRSDHG